MKITLCYKIKNFLESILFKYKDFATFFVKNFQRVAGFHEFEILEYLFINHLVAVPKVDEWAGEFTHQKRAATH
ncbi:MAG: hypothetical protein A2648_00695 [Candidatus Lloydbacteria bacterium RIFCSPHIGHO2_01_FULL_41_20]|uniref:Uncharacterized protein n=1 Tax=Candidatus Lloydbacteria bacterium RIFCSPHIGHO2_01_FULL_41_20 TaxID=1798657 RepID=A0A1G2CV44_9BACT|nr:MAG: hypothetical protein A2648_00695 [Candidatus Lloydbacteria bacterium RIFCSPHIGHO2_01_FULL_41_20]